MLNTDSPPPKQGATKLNLCVYPIYPNFFPSQINIISSEKNKQTNKQNARLTR